MPRKPPHRDPAPTGRSPAGRGPAGRNPADRNPAGHRAAAPQPESAEPQAKLQKISGLPAVAALFAREPGRVERLYFDGRLEAQVAPYCQMLAKARKPYRLVDGEELAKIAGSPMHGGVVAAVQPKPVPELDLGAARGWARAGRPLLILDGIGNPHNLGAIARTAAFFGMERLVVSDHPAQALPSDAAYRVSEGGLIHLDLYRAPRLPALLKGLRDSYLVVGTALGGSRPLEALAADPRPPAIVLGNEEHGLDRATLAACEAVVTLPGSGRIQSLNVAATAAIVIYGLTRGLKA
ncbi:MAG TPA: RNA methyltransferase [Alphaproteobacteria bacterium]|nr:RNA methyltransferase [Alphaproteobacteria bacterium]